MTWQRLMTYAHQNTELKPIPGIDDPFVAPIGVAKARPGQNDQADTLERPPVMSSATTGFLRDMSEIFRTTPPMEIPAQPETLSALQDAEPPSDQSGSN